MIIFLKVPHIQPYFKIWMNNTWFPQSYWNNEDLPHALSRPFHPKFKHFIPWLWDTIASVINITISDIYDSKQGYVQCSNGLTQWCKPIWKYKLRISYDYLVKYETLYCINILWFSHTTPFQGCGRLYNTVEDTTNF